MNEDILIRQNKVQWPRINIVHNPKAKTNLRYLFDNKKYN